MIQPDFFDQIDASQFDWQFAEQFANPEQPKQSRLQSALGSCAFAAGATGQAIKSIGRGAYNLTADVARYASNNPGEAAIFFMALATFEAIEDIEESL